MNRHGELVVQDETGRERERYGLTYGAKLYFGNGQHVKPGALLSEWDPFSVPILTEVSGVVKFGDIIEGGARSSRAVVVGGGLLGLEAAYGLRLRGVRRLSSLM